MTTDNITFKDTNLELIGNDFLSNIFIHLEYLYSSVTLHIRSVLNNNYLNLMESDDVAHSFWSNLFNFDNLGNYPNYNEDNSLEILGVVMTVEGEGMTVAAA